MRILLISAAVLCALAYFFWNSGPEMTPAQGTIETIEVNNPTPSASKSARRLAKERVPAVAERNTMPPVMKNDSNAREVDASAPEPEAPEGPFTVNLGSHKVHLRDDDRKRVAFFQLELVTDTDDTRREIRRRREQFVRMTYFLGSKRQADGVARPDGKERFERDLLERFQNIVHTGDISQVSLRGFELKSVPAKSDTESESADD